MQPTARRCHHERCRISSSQEREMFQSSLMSWSSQSIETETLAKSQRINGSRQLSWGRAGAPPSADLRARPRGALVDVDLVAEQEERIGPALAIALGHLVREY